LIAVHFISTLALDVVSYSWCERKGLFNFKGFTNYRYFSYDTTTIISYYWR